MAKKDFISINRLSKQEVLSIIGLAAELKSNPQAWGNFLSGKQVGLLFEKPSLRTKTSFYVGARQLGGEAIYYGPQEVCLGKREEVADVARTLSQYLEVIVLRTFSHKDILKFAQHSSVPVVNALSDLFHPSQVIADILTIIELKKNIQKINLAYVGDSNNVCNSLLSAFSLLGGNLSVAVPKQRGFNPKFIQDIKLNFKQNGGTLTVGDSPEKAVEGADIIYTDVWASMGSKSEEAKLKNIFKGFQVNKKLVQKAKKECIIMHCLPACRGQEISDDVIEGENSVVFLQAANRLHAAKAILMFVCG